MVTKEPTELFSVLGDDAKFFSFGSWHEGEQEIMKPALEKRGYTQVRFYMIEKDSFGPLIRGCVARDRDGNTVTFFYG